MTVGKRGPAPKPTALRVLHGDHKERINNAEPVPSAGQVKAPTWLSAPARAVWRQYAPDLERQGVLKVWDCEAFGNWCDAVTRRRHAAQELTEGGEVLESDVFDKLGNLTGHRLTKSPWVLVLNDADAQVQRWGARFGMSPSDRAQLKIGEAGRGSTDDLLSG